jgi:hypothetical protein
MTKMVDEGEKSVGNRALDALAKEMDVDPAFLLLF